MILNFADKGTADIFNAVDSKEARKTCPSSLWTVARRKLDMVNAAHDIRDLASPPANRLEKLKGKLAGRYSIRINDQYRVVFGWQAGNASEVVMMDYH
jgi:toxin HigB-1